ncbi:hypothetical protein ACFVGV_06035 [Pseudarthrobacter scleromae]|uniref:hypothetical protein n=1 Tax=Pseudarthrobacter scleromae TaxID=158897 RepID=UPI00363AF4BA
MLPGDFVLEPPTDAYSRAVATLGGSRYNHVRLIVDYTGRSVEAVAGGVTWTPEVYQGDLLVAAPLTDDQRGAILAASEPLIGRPYSRAGLLSLGLASFAPGLPWLRRELAEHRAFTCAHLVAHIWKAVGFDPVGRPAQSVTPGELADLALRRGWDVEEL